MNISGAILAMQAFNGLSTFCVLLLMALGLAIIFGQMGVINMAHGEFMTVGAYTTYLLSEVSQRWVHGLTNWYFFLAIVVAFIIAGAIGLLVEHLMIRKLYARPLDTLLATWGLSLIMQQGFRSVFGAREVSAKLPDWLMGSVKPTANIDIPINGLVVMGLTAILTAPSSSPSSRRDSESTFGRRCRTARWRAPPASTRRGSTA